MRRERCSKLRHPAVDEATCNTLTPSRSIFGHHAGRREGGSLPCGVTVRVRESEGSIDHRARLSSPVCR